MNRKLIRSLGGILGIVLSWLPNAHADVTRCDSSTLVGGYTYVIECMDYTERNSCVYYSPTGDSSGTGGWIYGDPCAGYKNGTGTACFTPDGTRWTDSQCQSYFGAGYVGNYVLNVPDHSGAKYYFAGCVPGAYMAQEDSCSFASGDGNMSCAFSDLSGFTDWCKPCSGFKIESGNFVTYDYSSGYGNSSGIFSWDMTRPPTTTGIQNCMGYVQSGNSFTDTYGTFELALTGCPYVL
jgi:hypothetical protein